jgi:hypothetical protein
MQHVKGYRMPTNALQDAIRGINRTVDQKALDKAVIHAFTFTTKLYDIPLGWSITVDELSPEIVLQWFEQNENGKLWLNVHFTDDEKYEYAYLKQDRFTNDGTEPCATDPIPQDLLDYLAMFKKETGNV